MSRKVVRGDQLMKVTVEYAAQIKRAAGRASEVFDVEFPWTVHDALQRVAERHGDALKNLLFDGDGRLHPSILLFVGDSQVRGDDLRELQNCDVLTVLSPISGG